MNSCRPYVVYGGLLSPFFWIYFVGHYISGKCFFSSIGSMDFDYCASVVSFDCVSLDMQWRVQQYD